MTKNQLAVEALGRNGVGGGRGGWEGHGTRRGLGAPTCSHI